MRSLSLLSIPWFRSLVPLVTILTISGKVWAQNNVTTGSVGGRVTESGEGTPIPAAVVTVRGTTIAVKTDGKGEYFIPEVPPGVYNLSFSKSGFKRVTVSDVKVAIGQRTNADADLAPEYFEMATFEVVSDPYDNQDAQLLQARQFDINLQDSIGSEFFSRAGASDAADIMTKVTGASVVGGKYVIIRGLGDRYGNTLLNGLEVPSADPDRKTVQMDIFPSSVIDNIVTLKTFTPDKPGSFTGGLVDIKTKSFPEKPFVKLSIGTTFNPQDNLNDDFISYPGGGTGRWGTGFGNREIPQEWLDGDAVNRKIADEFRIIRRSRSTDAEKAAAMAEIRRLTTQFNGAMGTTQKRSGLDEKYSASFGATKLIKGRKLGFLGGFNYGMSYGFVDDAQQNRFNASASNGILLPRKLADEVRASQQLDYSLLANTAYEMTDNWTVGATALYVRSVEDEAVFRQGINFQARDLNDFNQILHLTERDLEAVQLQSKIVIPDWEDASSDLKVSFAGTSQDEPDFRFMEYTEDPNTGVLAIFPAYQRVPTRIFRRVGEENVNVVFDNDFPFETWFGEENHLKLGILFSDSDRSFAEHTYTYDSGNNYGGLNDHRDPSEFATPDKIDLATNNFGQTRPSLFLEKANTAFYTGNQRVWAGYLMSEFQLMEDLRFVTGGRYETTNLWIVSDTARGINRTRLNDAHILPSASFIKALNDQMNLRIAFGKTIARPTFKEIAGVTIDDFVNNLQFTGNPDLVMTEANNYDIRWEWFPQPGEVLAASLFYKDLINPIELEQVTANDEVQPKNRDAAQVYGIELEARKNLEAVTPALSPFEVGMNFTYVQSEISTTPFEFENFAQGETSRPLAGQSPYIINFDLTYRNDTSGTTASIFYNIFGERLFLTSRITPSVFEKPAPSLDFSLSQQINEKFSVKFSAKNLLNPQEDYIITYNGRESIFSTRSRGRSFGISFSYEL